MLVTITPITGFKTKINVRALRFDLQLTTACSWARINFYFRAVGTTEWRLAEVWDAGAGQVFAYDGATDSYYSYWPPEPIGYDSHTFGLANLPDDYYEVALFIENQYGGTIVTNDIRLANLELDAAAEPGVYAIEGDTYNPRHLAAKEVEFSGLAEKNYDVRIWRTTPETTDGTIQDNIYLRGYAEVINNSLAYPNHALIGVRAMATDRLYGGRPRLTSTAVAAPLTVPALADRTETTCVSDSGIVTDYLTVNGLLVTGLRKVRIGAALSAPDGKYFWLVRMDSSGYADTAHLLTKHYLRVHTWTVVGAQTDIYLQDLEEIPAATELMLFHEDADPYIARHTAWAVAKMLIDGSHGRITTASIDWETFAAWDEWNMAIKPATGQPRHLFDAVVDFTGDLWSLAMKAAATARGNLSRKGNKFTVWMDKAASHVQVFGEGNSNNVSIRPIPRADRANILTTSYLDQALNYDQRDVSREDVQGSEFPIVKTVPLQIGVVRENQVNDLLDFMLLQNRYVGTTIDLEAGIDSIEVTIGGVFMVASQAKDAALSGRIVTINTTTGKVTLDQPFTPEPGETYQLTIWATDGDSYTWTDEVVGEALTELDMPVDLPPAEHYEYPYILAKVTEERLLYRCLGVRREADSMNATINGIEYRSEIYADD